MARNRKTQRPATFQAIAPAHLEWVVGGRLAISKGPDPKVIQGLGDLAKSVQQTGQVMQQKNQEQAGMMQQMMGQMKSGAAGSGHGKA
jgi:hypothetical protein